MTETTRTTKTTRMERAQEQRDRRPKPSTGRGREPGRKPMMREERGAEVVGVGEEGRRGWRPQEERPGQPVQGATPGLTER